MTTNTKMQRWERFQQFYLEIPEVGFAFDLSGMQFPAAYFEQMEPRMQKAFLAMEQLEGGGIANPDENRQVGHYWLRDPKRTPDARIGNEITQTVARIVQFAKRVHGGEIRGASGARLENVIVVGIGGSALGPQLVAAALGKAADPMRVFFVDNTDPDGIDVVLSRVAKTTGGLAATLTIVTSKSGGTKETRNGMLEVAAGYRRAGLAFEKHFIAITCPDSDLDKAATREQWLERFPMWDWVGGRTSVMSAVGLVPMSLQGLDVQGFLDGAGQMDQCTRRKDTRANPAALLALAWFWATGGAGRKDMVILPYKDRLELFSRYLQQLVMESLGKERDLAGHVVEQGIAVYGNKGSTDQHAYVQQLREGVHNFFVTFIEVLKERDGARFDVEPGVTSGDYLSAFLQGTRRALHDKCRETITITIDQVNATRLGALIALYERAVGLYATLVGINAYHQPGVEAGKKAATAVLTLRGRLLSVLKESSRPLDVVDLASAAGASGEEETVFKIMNHLAANGLAIRSGHARGTQALFAVSAQ